MTITNQLSPPGNNLIKMLTGNTQGQSAKFGRPQIRKSGAHPEQYFGENPCCATKPERNTLSEKNIHSEFFKIFSELYAGVYQIK